MIVSDFVQHPLDKIPLGSVFMTNDEWCLLVERPSNSPEMGRGQLVLTGPQAGVVHLLQDFETELVLTLAPDRKWRARVPSFDAGQPTASDMAIGIAKDRPLIFCSQYPVWLGIDGRLPTKVPNQAVMQPKWFKQWAVDYCDSDHEWQPLFEVNAAAA